MSPTPDPQVTARDVLLSLQSQGFSLAEIGRQIGRSPRALRFVLNRERSGEQLLESLTELDLDGKVTHQAPRPVTRSGHRAKVRGKGGTSIEPPAPAGAGVRRRRRRSVASAPRDVRSLIDAARADGLSYRQIGEFVGRSADTVRRVHHGQGSQASTEALQRPLTELYVTGSVEHQAGRGTTSTGRYRKIPGPGGVPVEPPTPKGSRPPRERQHRPSRERIEPRAGGVPSTSVDQPQFPDVPPAAPSTLRGRAKAKGPALQHEALPGGAHFYNVTVSKAGRQDRARSNPELVDVFNAASNARRRVEFSIRCAEDPSRDIPFGGKAGWDPATVAAAIDKAGGNAWAAFQKMVYERYSKEQYGELTPVSVQIHVW